MFSKRLATRAGFLPALVILVMTSLFVVAGTDAHPALAYGLPPLPVSLPGTIAGGAAVIESEGTVAAVTTVAGTAVGVAAAPVLLVAGAALVTGGAIALVWHWKTGHSTTYASPPGAPSNTCYTVDSFSTACGSGSAPGPNRSNAFLYVNPLTTTLAGVPTQYWSVRAVGATYGEAARCVTVGINQTGSQSGHTGASISCDTVTYGAFQYWYVADNRNGTSLFDSRNAGSGGNPTVTSTPRSNCQAPGGTAHYVSGSAITYAGDTADGALPPIVAPACPQGEQRIGFDVPTTGAGGATVPAPVAPWTAPTIPSAFPECNPAGTCQLVLTQVAPNGDTITCNGTTDCQGWATQPKLAPKRTVWKVATGTQVATLVPTAPDGTTYRCQWGPYELEATECSTVPTEPTTGTADPPAGSSGDDWCKWKLSKPWTWPYTALECAFVPRPGSVDADVATLRTAWSGTVVGVFSSAFTDIAGPLVGATGSTSSPCEGPTFTVGFTLIDGSFSVNPFSACGDYLGAASLVVLSLARIALYLGVFAIGSRMIMRTIGIDSPMSG